MGSSVGYAREIHEQMETTPPGIDVRVAVFDDGVAGHGEGFGIARVGSIH
jgi:hypothetical protein